MASGEMTEVEFTQFLTDTLRAAAHVSRDGALHYICMDCLILDQFPAR